MARILQNFVKITIFFYILKFYLEKTKQTEFMYTGSTPDMIQKIYTMQYADSHKKLLRQNQRDHRRAASGITGNCTPDIII